MSGVTGNQRIQGRNTVTQIVESYRGLISRFSGFVSLSISGSWNSNPYKTSFGDIDLIVHIDGSLYNNDKSLLKKELVAFMNAQSESVIAPFESEKYKGKRTYNSGEIVSVSYQCLDNLPCQIDNIIALTKEEAEFKQHFLDMPAEKQGLLLGLTKVILLEESPTFVFDKLGLDININLHENQELCFNLSSVELQLRLVTYEDNTFNEVDRQVLWRTNQWDHVECLFSSYNIKSDFNNLVSFLSKELKSNRSRTRLVGVFKSMISVKTGEVGTDKEKIKNNAISTVSEMLTNKIIKI